jgi:hypothetical protein
MTLSRAAGSRRRTSAGNRVIKSGAYRGNNEFASINMVTLAAARSTSVREPLLHGAYRLPAVRLHSFGRGHRELKTGTLR